MGLGLPRIQPEKEPKLSKQRFFSVVVVAWLSSRHLARDPIGTFVGPLSLQLTKQGPGRFQQVKKFSDRSFFEPPWGHGRPRLRVMDVRAEMLVFQDFEGLTEVFAPGRPPGYPRGRPQDIWPQTYSLGCFFLMIRKFCWRDFAQKRWVVLLEMFVGGGLDSHSFGEGRSRSLATSLAILALIFVGRSGVS